MNFSVEKMYRLPDADGLRAFADVCCDGVLIIKGVRVLKGVKGLFVSMPQEQGKDNKWYDQVVFRDAHVYERFEQAVLAHYVRESGEPVLDDVPMTPRRVDASVWTNVQ